MIDRRTRMLRDFVVRALREDAMGGQARPRVRLSKDSIDNQVDSILLGYESDCIVSVGAQDEAGMGESIMREAPQPELGTPEEEEQAEEDLANQTGNQEDAVPDEESDPLQPKIDLHKFAGKVSRLASNYDALLNMPIAIVNRARNYLEQNYSKAVADEFSEIMERDFDIEMDIDIENTEPREIPMATGAAASGLGG